MCTVMPCLDPSLGTLMSGSVATLFISITSRGRVNERSTVMELVILCIR